jgi:hypothetical protein
MRTAMELCLMEFAEWEGENESPVGSFAHVVIDDDARNTDCDDSDANEWLKSSSGVQHFIIQWMDDGRTYVGECYRSERAAIETMDSLRDAYNEWCIETMNSLRDAYNEWCDEGSN